MGILYSEVCLNELAHKLIAVDAADEGSCALMVGDICGVLGENIANQLVYGVIALFSESLINCGNDCVHLMILIVVKGEFLSLSVGLFCHFYDSFLREEIFIVFCKTFFEKKVLHSKKL